MDLVTVIHFIFLLIQFYPFSNAHHPDKPTPTPYHDWDYLLFSQRWPISACLKWLHEGRLSQYHICNLPKTTSWTVHGLWPTKINKLGPLYCPSPMHFDPDQLAPLIDQLNEHWTNVEANTGNESFWKHEWSKHGTCASVLPTLNSVTNYFQTGLIFNQKYEFFQVLQAKGIVPNDQQIRSVSDFVNTIEVNLGNKKIGLQCITVNNQRLISEIRICFDKNLELIDCVGGPDHLFGECEKLQNTVLYPNSTAEVYSYE